MYKFYIYTANNGKEIKKSLLKKGNWEDVNIIIYNLFIQIEDAQDETKILTSSNFVWRSVNFSIRVNYFNKYLRNIQFQMSFINKLKIINK